MSVLVCGGAGGRIDPLALRRGDLSASGHDGLLRNLRKALRESGVLQGAGPWGIPAIWSMEPQRWPTAGSTSCFSASSGWGVRVIST